MSNINFDVKKASHYEGLAHKVVFGYDQLFTMALSFLIDKQNEMKNVLVVGCGTGMELATFGGHMSNWQFTGVDPSEEMIKLSKTKVAGYGLSERTKFHKGFVEDLPEENKYDAATLIYVLRFISDEAQKLSLLKNIAKRLVPGARIIIVDQFGDPSLDNFQFMSKAWRKFMKLNGVSPELASKIAVQAYEESFFTENRIQQLLTEAGFGKLNRFYNSFMHGGWVVEKK